MPTMTSVQMEKIVYIKTDYLAKVKIWRGKYVVTLLLYHEFYDIIYLLDFTT